jgi:ABC-type nitrate/sulfonate/bicarbonate transport system substrate-binding protein
MRLIWARRSWCLAGLLLSLASPVEAAEPVTVRLAQNLSPISGLTIIAKAKGFFERTGLSVSVSDFTSGKQCLDTVIGGAAEFATAAEAPVTAATMAGQKIAYIAGMEFSDDKTLTASAAGIRKASDLKGKRIAYTAGTGSEVYTTQLLKTAGLTSKDVTLINLKPQDMLPALAAGSIDAFDTWEPHISNGRKAMGDKVSELDTKGIYAETFNIVVMQSFLKSDPRTVDKFLAALLESETWMKANPEEAVGIIAKKTGMKAEDLQAIWSGYVFHVAIGETQINALKTHAQWRLDSNNHPPGATMMPDFSKVVFPGSLRALDASRVSAKGY